MSALAKTIQDTDFFELFVGTNGEWIVRGPGGRSGGLFVSQAAAEAFVRQEMRCRPDAARQWTTAHRRSIPASGQARRSPEPANRPRHLRLAAVTIAGANER